MQVLRTEEYARQFGGSVVLAENGQLALREEWDYEREVEDGFLTDEEIEARQRELVPVSPSRFVEFAIRMPDKVSKKHIPFSFEQRRYLRLPYDTSSKRTLYKCGRQVEKSTLLGNKCLAYACINNAFNILYVSPTNQQTKTFSMDRLKEPIETSDKLGAWTTTKLSDNVFLKKFINRSQVTLRYAFHNADRTRGIPADMILLDEIQDIITDNIPVIEECASHSPYKVFIYSGTPKSFDNTIEHFWVNFSTQNEWAVPCERHGVPGDPSSWHWNILSESNMSPDGLICDKCGGRIHSMHPYSQWVSLNPGIREKLGKDGAYEGFRIPQLMVPWLKPEELWVKYQTYSRAKFYNEVLGESYDSGSRPLTRQDVIDNCEPGLFMSQAGLQKAYGTLGQTNPVFCGIDWGTGEGSFTSLVLGAYLLPGKFTIFYAHRFEGQETEPQVQLDLIETLIRHWRPMVVACDYGGGFDRNDTLIRKFGRERVIKYQYSQPSQKVKWEPELNRFLVHRTEVMSDIFNAIKRRDVFRFPDWETWEDPFAKDFLSIFSEYNEQARQIQYKKSPDQTDDTFHATLLCFLGSMLKVPRFDVINPTAKTSGLPED